MQDRIKQMSKQSKIEAWEICNYCVYIYMYIYTVNVKIARESGKTFQENSFKFSQYFR